MCLLTLPPAFRIPQTPSADNVLQGSKQEQMEAVRGHIRAFKEQHGLDKVIVLWTANTERFAAIEEGAYRHPSLPAACYLPSTHVCTPTRPPTQPNVSPRPGNNDTAENLLAAIARGEEEISPSTLFAVASVLEGCSYINGSPQNTFVPGVVELAERHKVRRCVCLWMCMRVVVRV